MKNYFFSFFSLFVFGLMSPAKIYPNINKLAIPTVQNFRVTSTTFYLASTTFSWNPVTGNYKYRIYIKNLDWDTSNLSPYDVSGDVSTSTCTLGADVMSFPYNYSLYIVAVDANGNEGTQSTVIYYENGISINTPPTPTVTVLNTTALSLNWANSTSANIIGYNIYINNNYNGSSTNNSYNVVGLQVNTNYSITISAVDKYGNCSSKSAGISATTNDYCKPSYQSTNYDANSYIQQVSLITDGSGADLTYPTTPRTTAPTGITYTNYAGVTGVPVPAMTVGTTNNILKVTVAANGDRNAYMYAFIDFDDDGIFEDNELVTMGRLSYKGSGLNSITTGVPVTFVSAPIPVKTSAIASGQVRMRIMYERFRATDGTMWKLSDIDRCALKKPSTSTNTDIYGYGQIQDFTVNITAPAASSARTANPIAKTEEVALEQKAVEETLTKPDPTNLTIYPNPVSGDFMNITAIENNTPYAIYNVAGQEVSTGKVNNGTINVANLSKGNYLLQVQVNDQRIVKQFIKQ